MRPRGIVGALFVVAVGAILAYAVHYTVAGINIRTVGFIIMAAGAVALIAVVARAFTDSQRQNRLEDRQDEQVRAANRPAPGPTGYTRTTLR
jgi:membrane protein implicated in regulation of membrane protease activity